MEVLGKGRDNRVYAIQLTHPTQPKEVAKTLNDSPHGTFVDEILYGDIPEDNSNQVMIDDVTATYFAQKDGYSSIEGLIGKTIVFQTHHSYPDSYKGIRDEDYKGEYSVAVSGIYKLHWNKN